MNGEQKNSFTQEDGTRKNTLASGTRLLWKAVLKSTVLKSAALWSTMLLACTLLFSCTTLQEEVKTTVSDEDIAAITKQYELELVALDGRSLAVHDAGLSLSANPLTVEKQSVEKKSAEVKGDALSYLVRIQQELSSSKMSRPLRCRLLALSGRASLIAEKPVQAKKWYDEAAAIEADDIQVLILGLRLEPDYATRIAKMSGTFTDEEAPLQIEQALCLYYMGQYAKAAAAFDDAFVSLDHAYRDAYGQLRDTSWLLQSAVGTVSSDATAKTLSADGMLLLIQSETTLLLPVTGGKTLKAKELASKMEQSGILDDDIAKKVGDRHASLYRADIARAVWRLYITYKNTKANVDYASQFSGQESPIPDVPVTDAAFASVAGCVENELMELPDGIHFLPYNTISGPEFVKILNKF